MTDILERELRDLFSNDPQSAPTALVDAAIRRASVITQRRPRFAVLDRRAWPPQARTAADPAVHRTIRVLAVAVIVLLLAAVIAAGARLLDRPPSVRIVTAGTLDRVVRSPRLALWPDGRVLIEGEGGARYLFDPATEVAETLEFGPDWALAHTDVLPDGRVVLTRSRDVNAVANGAIDVAFYDRATGVVQPVGSLATPWFAAATLVLHDGRILISGGVVFPGGDLPCGPLTCDGVPTPAPTATNATSEGAKDTVRIFDPGTGATIDVGHLQVARFQHDMLELEDGRILIVGGGDYATDAAGNSEALEVELFDLATGASKVIGSIRPGRGPFQLSPVRMDDGSIFIPEASVSEFPCGIPSFMPGQPAHPEDIRTIYRQPTRLFEPANDRLIDGPTVPHFFGSNLVPLSGGRVLVFGAYELLPADCATASTHLTNPWLGVADLRNGAVFESFDPMTGTASLDVTATRVYGAGIRLPDGRVALIADDPGQQQVQAFDIVTIGP